MTQLRLAELAGTSQATVSAYEAGRKRPSIDTLGRLLAVCGARIEVTAPDHVPSQAELLRAGTVLEDVLVLAEHLPFARPGPLRFPRLVEYERR